MKPEAFVCIYFVFYIFICIYIYIYIFLNLNSFPTGSVAALSVAVIYILYINPLKSELFKKQACRDELVVYSLFFSPTILLRSTPMY